MNTLQTAEEKLQAAKTEFCELFDKHKRANDEADRLATLLQATEAEATACVDERKAFIESGGDVFDPRAKKLRKQGQEHLDLIDDLKFAIETHCKRADEMLFDLSEAHRRAESSKDQYVSALFDELVCKVLQNPPEDLLRACHFASVAALGVPLGWDRVTLECWGEVNYENMFKLKIQQLFTNQLRNFTHKSVSGGLVTEEEKTLLHIPVFEEKLSPARAHFIKALRAGKFDNAAYPYAVQEAIRGGGMEARSKNLESI